jgi:hypothetical protein
MTQRLDCYYIVPSRYDDDGYVYRYWRGVVPSNSVMCLKGLTEGAAERGELGDVDVRVHISDDCVQRPPLRRIARRHRRRPGSVLVGFVGVQSNQFARATDMALELRRAGVPVMIGGFHVSGMLAMFDRPSEDLQRLLDAGVTLVKGEVEAPGVMASLLRDAVAGALKPVYDVTDPPDLEHAPVPRMDRRYLKRFLLGSLATMDTSRGCPYNCSFCTIINVQGKKMRCRSAASILKAVRENYEAEVQSYFFTDDNMARSPVWETVFDGLRVMRERGLNIQFMMQVDTQAYRIPGFVRKAQRAGCHTVFVGMETVNPKNIEATGKNQNDAASYRRMVDTWHDADIRVHVGYIIGLPHDTPESVRQDVKLLRDFVQVDEASFFMLTPLPGSRDHQQMRERAVPIDADLNNLDSYHETFRHPNFEPGRWRATFQEAWDAFYSKESVISILLRAPRSEYWGLFWTCLWYRWSSVFVQSHPMSTGLFRLKDRRARRPGHPVETRFAYAWRRLGDLAWGTKVYARLFWEFQEVWFLTRKPDDPRWKTVADLRERWARLQHALGEQRLSERGDAASQEVRATLEVAVGRLRDVCDAPRGLSARARKNVRVLVHDAESYLRSFEMQMPTVPVLRDARRFVGGRVLAGYENMSIRYVARRRRLNAVRRLMLRRLRSGAFSPKDAVVTAQMLVFEALLAFRFVFTALRQGV